MTVYLVWIMGFGQWDLDESAVYDSKEKAEAKCEEWKSKGWTKTSISSVEVL